MATRAERRANRIIAMSIALALLVSTVVALLGRRLLTQEETLMHQQARDRLERTADQMVNTFASRLLEIESWLARDIVPIAAISPLPGAGVLVLFSEGRIDVASSGTLLYYPRMNRPSVDLSVFARADELEFKTSRLDDATSILQGFTSSEEPAIRAEAMLRLARVLAKQERVADAIAAYDRLSRMLANEDPPDDIRMSRELGQLLLRSEASRNFFFVRSGNFEPAIAFGEIVAGKRREPVTGQAGVPYRLLSLFAKCQLLAASGREEEAREESRRLVSELASGRWRLDKASFTFYDSSTRKLAGLAPPPASRVAVAEQVLAIWDLWQAFRATGASSQTQRLYQSGNTPVIALVSGDRDQLAALVIDGEAFRSVGLDLDSVGAGVLASLTDQRSTLILGKTLEAPGVEVVRSLSSLAFPWQLRLMASDEEAGSLLHGRRNYAIMALSVFVLLVFGACYAIARGVRREAVAGQLQGDFVSAVSHEFRSPLTALRQLTELLAQGRVQDESRRRVYFDVLLRETSRLHQLVEDLLDFGRMDAGRQQYHFELLDFSALVRDSIREYETEADASQHKIDVTTQGLDLTVRADSDAVKRVVRNLIENAVKYSPGAPAIWVDVSSGEDAAVLRVRDEGIGVPAEEQSRIFEKFVRGKAAKNACIPGTGIGLAMVKEIVHVHRGQVTVQSDVGRGSTFIVRLPIDRRDRERSGT
jgi:signal transduction histidine kinase